MGIYDNMDRHHFAVERHLAVAAPLAVARGAALPFVAGTRYAKDAVSPVDNENSAHYGFQDVLASLVEHVSEAPRFQGNQGRKDTRGRLTIRCTTATRNPPAAVHQARVLPMGRPAWSAVGP